MTNEEIITELLDHGLNEAADLIEKLQRERDRWERAATKVDNITRKVAYKEGFRAGLEQGRKEAYNG